MTAALTPEGYGQHLASLRPPLTDAEVETAARLIVTQTSEQQAA